MISLVVPTYNEAPVLELTLRRAAEVLKEAGEPFELIVVDDSSPDGTAAIAEQLSAELPVRVLCRKGKRGLATAVVKGWKIARGDVVGVMDADLQHPPEVVCRLIKALRAEEADLAVASRYRPGGGTEGWTWFRRLVSIGGAWAGAVALPWTLSGVTDSGSGMFLVRARALEGVELKPVGIKLFLEVLARGHVNKLVEVPYVFRGRTRGESKIGTRQFFEYLLHLLRIGRNSGELETWIYFKLAAVTGALVYVAALVGLEARTNWPLPVALLMSIPVGMLVSLVADSALTFRRVGAKAMPQSSAASRLFRYVRLTMPAGLFNGLTTFLLRTMGLELWMAAFLGALAGMFWTFMFAVPAIWGIWHSTARQVVVAEKMP